MQENEELNQQEVETLDTDYIKTINDLKANSVSKDEYNKLLDQSRKLVNQLATNQTIKEEQPVEVKTAQELRNELFGKEHNNLEYCDLALQLREAVLREEGKDIFVANNTHYRPGQDSYEAAARVASVIGECIEYADGDSEAFTTELSRRTNDVSIGRRR